MELSYLAAFTGGLLSFLAPCVLPLVPAYISFMTGASVDQLRSGEGVDRRQVMLRAGWYSVSFVLGFSLVFILLGASATALGQLLLKYMTVFSKVGGVLVVIFGLHYMGVFKIGFLNMEARFNLESKPTGAWGAFAIGLAFAFGWTPCVGPILAAILGMAGGQETVVSGMLLLAVYSAGLGVPFIIAGLAINSFMGFSAGFRRHMHKVEMGAGVLLVLIGVLIFMGDLTLISSKLLHWFPSLAELG